MRIAIYAFEGITLFHLSVPQMVFGEVARQGLAPWETFVVGDRPGGVRTAEGHRLEQLAGLEEARGADVLVIPSWHADGREIGDELRDLLQAVQDGGGTAVGLCLGAIPVVDSGILHGRPAVTHWHAFDLLRSRHPGFEADESVLYIDHGDVLTSAGTAAGLDACLHFVRSRLGAEAANVVARSLVIAPHREGGQAQYIERPLAERPDDGGVAAAMEWALEHLAEPLPVPQLAAAAHMSHRSFVRAFRRATGATPAAWVRERRVDAARQLLETTDLSIDQVAGDCGFGSVVTFRQAFAAAFRVTPSTYRRQFRGSR